VKMASNLCRYYEHLKTSGSPQVDEHGMEYIDLVASSGTSCRIYAHGAHVTSWKHEGVERLFVSKEAVFKPPKAIRGGIPVCWPQFGDLGPLKAQHGFARNVAWRLDQVARRLQPDGSSDVSATWVLSSDMLQANPVPGWPHAFTVSLVVALSAAKGLVQTLTVANTTACAPSADTQEKEAKAWSFTTALHTYFKVESIEGARVSGLRGCEYLDSLDGRCRKTDTDEALSFPHEVDRIYKGCLGRAPLHVLGAACASTNGAAAASVSVSAAGFTDAVVWNPWVAKAKARGDYGDDEYKNHVCVEVAQCDPVRLSPGETWTATQTLLPGR